MHPFTYHCAGDADAAVRAGRSGSYIAGGTNMTDYMRLDVLRPASLVDVNRLADKSFHRIKAGPDGLCIGALVRMGQAEDHPVICKDYPVIHQALKFAATRQIRNMASLGGNMLQRTRCEYFHETSWPCNKREPGSGCAAIGGVNRQHAVLGTSHHCIAAYPGDFAHALLALDATVETLGPAGPRHIEFDKFHVPPGETPHVETVLAPGELVTAIHVPSGPHTARSCYIKICDRSSYQFALAGAAVALHLVDRRVEHVRIALSGVATKPWRPREAEDELKGRTLTEARAAEAAFAEARPDTCNAFKIEIGKQTIVRALLEAQALRVAA